MFKKILVPLDGSKRAEKILPQVKELVKFSGAEVHLLKVVMSYEIDPKKDKEELEEKILLNVKELVNPYLDKLKKSIDDKKGRVYLDILEANLRTLTSSFSRDLHFKYLNLTPTELRIAGLIREGKTSKDIAEFMNLSTRTIESHRKSIRRKMGLTAKKRNLRTLLLGVE